jgi:hypothetical protein
MKQEATIRTEVACSPETSVEFQRTTRRYNPYHMIDND